MRPYKEMPMEKEEMSMEGIPSELQGAVGEVAQAEDESLSAMSPQGQFSKASLNSLVKAFNKLMPLFGKEAYPEFDADQMEFPPEFVRLFLMVMEAVGDAIEQEIVGQDVAFELGAAIKDDRDLAMLTGKLDILSRSKDFKKFLKEPAREEMEVEGPGLTEETEGLEEQSPASAMSDKEIDALFASRM